MAEEKCVLVHSRKLRSVGWMAERACSKVTLLITICMLVSCRLNHTVPILRALRCR